MAYSIKQIADLAGVTTRAIRFYDQIGLLAPVQTGQNGYRYYDRGCLLRLQQIMFFRELDVPLNDIRLIMSQPDFDLLGALERHRLALRNRHKRLERLIHTIDQTILALKGEEQMNDKAYFDGFDESAYAEEVRQRWGDTPAYAESQKKWAGYSADQKAAIKAESGAITKRMVGASAQTKPDDPQVQAAIADYLRYINQYFYTCDKAILRQLADMWVADPRFAVNYERIRPGGATFVREAVHYFCDKK
ncbi:MerR family transcriptional regulator [Patescibacteria group bacterium]|nr:MerR family transcriptional regulator [Patescibacteria group bacterium]